MSSEPTYEKNYAFKIDYDIKNICSKPLKCKDLYLF